MGREDGRTSMESDYQLDGSTSIDSFDLDEIEDYKAVMNQMLCSTCAAYSQQVDRTKHFLFGSKIIQETSLYTSTIQRWHEAYKKSSERDQRKTARRVVRELVESGCRFYQPHLDEACSNILIPVQDVEKIETRVLRDLEDSIPTSEDSLGAQACHNYPKTQPVNTKTCNQEVHVDIPSISCNAPRANDCACATEEDDMSSVHEVSIEMGKISRSSSAFGLIQGSGGKQGVEAEHNDSNPAEREPLDPSAPLQWSNLESWSLKQMQTVKDLEDEKQKPLLKVGYARPDKFRNQENPDVAERDESKVGKEISTYYLVKADKEIKEVSLQSIKSADVLSKNQEKAWSTKPLSIAQLVGI